MSIYIDLNSSLRTISTYPNPFDYMVESTQVATWSPEVRTVVAVSTVPKDEKVLSFSEAIEIEGCTIPYAPIQYTNASGTVVTTHTADLRHININVYSMKYNDSRLVYSMDDSLIKVQFALHREQIQVDSTGNPAWLYFKTRQMDQVMRWAKNDPIRITFSQEQGFPISIINPTNNPVISGDPANQNWLLLELTPYFRDSNYSNHFTGLRAT